MDHQHACVWATSKDRWDSFLNDPELARALDNARNGETARLQEADQPDAGETADLPADNDDLQGQRIGARLRAYETPITDEILRQSIR